MAKLNQIISIEKGIKAQSYGEVSELNKLIQKPDLFNGFSKTYQRKDEESEELPAERKKVQLSVAGVLSVLGTKTSELMNVTARKDWTNCEARADVTIGDKAILTDVPVTYLLFLEKQLTDIRTFIKNLPTLDESEDWIKDENAGLFKTPPSSTHRTKKVQKPIVLYDATEVHPAQTQLITEDILVGYWQTIKQSGAITGPQQQEYLGRVEMLLHAVKQAREQANGIEEAPVPQVGQAIFNYVFDLK